MGAAQSNPKRLNRVQDAAALIIGDVAGALDSLEHRRRVGASMDVYKIQSWDVPDKLRQMIPPILERPPRSRARASALEHDTWYEYKFERMSKGVGPDYVARGYLFSALLKIGIDYRWMSLQAVLNCCPISNRSSVQ